MNTIAHVDALGGIAMPNSSAKSTLNFRTYIDINDTRRTKAGSAADRTSIESAAGNLSMRATTEGLTVKNDALSKGKGGGGVSNATAWTVANLQNVIWIDNAKLYGLKVALTTDNGTGDGKTHIIGTSHAALKGLAGKVAPTTRISGEQVNQIRSSDPSKVSMTAYYSDGVTHVANNPEAGVRTTPSPMTARRLSVKQQK